MIGGAKFSSTGKYRHRLWRVWNAGMPRCNFICLNPSIADAKKNDHSVTKMIGFATAFGCGALDVTNLFDIVTTYPSDLVAWFNDRELSSKHNNGSLLRAAKAAKFVVCAWGNHGVLNGRGAEVIELLWQHKHKLKALKLNHNGTPAHPLRLPYSLRLIPFGESHDR